MKYIPALDGVRAIAIILVMLFHYYYLVEIGWVGVQLFFVLSGFLITSILLNEKNKTLGVYLKRFYWRRSLRIFPIYYLYIILVGIVFLATNFPENYNVLAPYLYTYTFNYLPLKEGVQFDVFFTHFWSLSVEEQFYIIWPMVIFLFNKKTLKYILVAIIIGSPIFRFFVAEWLISNNYLSSEIGEIVYRLTPSQLDGFAFGALIPIFNLGDKKWNFSWLLYLSLALFVIVGITVYALFDGNLNHGITSLGFPIGETAHYQHVWSYLLINLVSLTLILFVLKKQSLFSRVMSSKFFVEVGKVSYGMYVYHWVIIAFFRKTISLYIPNHLISFIIYFILVYIVSYLSFRLFENYFIKLKDKKFNTSVA